MCVRWNNVMSSGFKESVMECVKLGGILSHTCLVYSVEPSRMLNNANAAWLFRRSVVS